MTGSDQRRPRRHPGRRLRPLPRLRRARRRAHPAHRRRPDRAGHPAAQRARAHRGARRLPDDGHPGVRRAARRRVRRGAPGLRHLHPGPGRRGPRPRPGAAPPARRPRRHRPQLRRAVRAAAAGRGLRRGGRADCRRTSAATATSRPGCPQLQAAIARDVRRARAAHRPRPDHGHAGRPGARPRSWPRRSPGPATGCWSSRRSTPTPPRRCATAAPGSSASPVDPDGWDLDAVARRAAPDLAAAGLPDPRLPEPHRPADDRRAAGGVRRAPAARPHGRGRRRGAPGAAARGPADAAAVRGVLAPDTITIGSASKSFWGGLRLGWIRAPHEPDGPADPRPGRASTSARRCSSSWSCCGCSRTRPTIARPATATRLREQRDALVAALRDAPARRGEFRVPTGGLALWCELPEAARHRAGRRGRAARRHRRARAGLRRRGRARPVRPDPVDPAGRGAGARPCAGSRAAWDDRTRPAAGGRRAGATGAGSMVAYGQDRAQARSTARTEAASMACSISSSVSAGIARVDRQRDQGVAALGVAGDLHAGDVDAGVAEDPADGADHAGAVLVGEERQVVGRLDVDVEAVDLDEPLALVDADQGAAHRDLRAVGEGAADRDQVAVVGALGLGRRGGRRCRARPRAAARSRRTPGPRRRR